MYDISWKHKTPSQRLYHTVTKLDLFGHHMDNNHNDGIKIYRSIFGSIISVIFVVILTLYTGFKYDTLVNFNDTTILIST